MVLLVLAMIIPSVALAPAITILSAAKVGIAQAHKKKMVNEIRCVLYVEGFLSLPLGLLVVIAHPRAKSQLSAVAATIEFGQKTYGWFQAEDCSGSRKENKGRIKASRFGRSATTAFLLRGSLRLSSLTL